MADASPNPDREHVPSASASRFQVEPRGRRPRRRPTDIRARRNQVWRTEESLWHDVTTKSPANGRGSMNYGLALMGKGQLDEALRCSQRARPLVPNYSYLHVNMGIALAAKGDTVAAEQSFLTGPRLAANSAEHHFYYARFLKDRGRLGEALSQVQKALEISPAHPDARHLLLALLGATGGAGATGPAGPARQRRRPGVGSRSR